MSGKNENVEIDVWAYQEWLNQGYEYLRQSGSDLYDRKDEEKEIEIVWACVKKMWGFPSKTVWEV